jgi:MSHA biogenesis protein MshN
VVVVEGRMSVINKMLQDLDRRQALGAGAEAGAVRAPSAKSAGHEWFWRVLVVLLTAALAWMGWVAVQLLPRKPLVTELAFQAAAEAQSRAAAKPAAAPAAPAPVVAAPPVAVEPSPVAPAAAASVIAAPAPVAAAPAAAAPEQPKPAPAVPTSSDALKLALQLETPVLERKAVPAKTDSPAPSSLKARPKPAAPQAAAKTSVDKRDRGRPAGEGAEAHFRRAALLLNHGRVSEAEDQLASALRADPAHAGARQAYIALLLEQQRVAPAQRMLQEALAIDPRQPTLALALARIYAGQREYQAAQEVMERAGPAAGHAEFQAMRGAVLQRLGRHAEAVEAYQEALRGSNPPATSWIGLAMSLEALGRRGESLLAYRRSLAAGPMPAEAREYAENRARALE